MAVLTLVLILSNSAIAFANDVYDIRLSGGLNKTRLVIELDKKVAFKVYNISDPYRLIVDFDAVNFNLPENIGTKTFGLIKEFRYGNFSQSKSRIVLDTVGKTEVSAAFIIPPKSNKGALLVVDIISKHINTSNQSVIKSEGKQNLSIKSVPSIDDDLKDDGQMIDLDFQPSIPSIDELMAIVASGDNPVGTDQNSSNLPQSKVDVSSLDIGSNDDISKPTANGYPDANTISAQKTTSLIGVSKPVKRPSNYKKLVLALLQNQSNPSSSNNTKNHRKPTIILDAGHGGIDGGTVSLRGTREKTVVLSFAKRLQKKLNATGRYKVYLTRKGDYFIKLRDRVKISRKYKADLFISLHADSVPGRNSSARGASIYTLSDKASDKEAAALARKENRSDILAGVEFKNESKVVTSILIDLAQRDSKTKSVKFATYTANQMRGNVLVRKRPIKFGNLSVLKAPDIPSVLIELGYLSNKHDERNLKSSAWQNKMALSLQRSIDQYFKNRLLF